MDLEIEAKISVPSLEPIVQKLNRLGAKMIDSVKEIDTYFMDCENRLHTRGCALRIRKQSGSRGNLFFVTFKGPRASGHYKIRKEVETQIEDYDAFFHIFEGLGYTPRITIEKKRQLWEWNRCTVCLDELPKLGYFVEVEGPSEAQVKTVLTQLDLSDLPHIPSSYATLTADALGLSPLEIKDLDLKNS